MSRRNGTIDGDDEIVLWTEEEGGAIRQSLDIQMVEHVKELLCSLWKGGRIDIDTRCQGENALSAALHAIENPDLRNLTLRQGATLANRQWMRDQRRSGDEF